MPSTFFGLSISKSGLYTAMGGINTTAHNISNAETDGYCRQIVKQQASSALRVNTNYGMAGNGVDVTGNGLPLFRAVVKRRGNVFNSPLAFGQAVQEALDVTTYRYCLERLRLLRVDQLPGGYIGLTLTVGG